MGFAALLAACAAALAHASSLAPGDVLVAPLRNEIIHPLTAQYLVQSIAEADEEKAELLVIELDTPGGLVDSTKEIVQAINAAKTPIAVYVAPSGARAASAGFFILISADVAAMAPATNTGAAHPIDVAGVAGAPEKKDDVGLEKAENDIAAFVRTTAENRGRNVELAEKAVRESASYTEHEALEGKLVDLVAVDRADLLRKLDGRVVRRFDGSERAIRADGAVRVLEKSVLQRTVGPLLHPQIVLLLLGLGVMGLYVEISHPGMIFPGVVGVLCLLLAALAFQFLPVNTVGILLVALGLGLFVLELKVTSYGALTIGGFACLILGLLMMFPRDVPALRVPIGFVLPLAFAVGGVMTFFVVLVARAQRTPIATGVQGMVGEEGRAASTVAADGKVYVHGELWDARSASPIAAGDAVRVLAVAGSVLVVQKKEKA
jgi:membrane-bound serine protease (ClpP class)